MKRHFSCASSAWLIYPLTWHCAAAVWMTLSVSAAAAAEELADWGPAPERVFCDFAYRRGAVLHDGFLFFTSGRHLHIADVRQPLKPRLLKALPVPGIPGPLSLLGNRHLALTNGASLAVWDISTPPEAKLVHRSLVGYPEHKSPAALAPWQHFLLIPCRKGGLAVADVRRPEQPELLPALPLPGMAEDVTVDPGAARAYVACDRGVAVVDLSEPPGKLLAFHPVHPSVDRVLIRGGELLIASKKAFLRARVDSGKLELLSSTPQIAFGFYAFPYDLQLFGSQVFIACGEGGLQILGWPKNEVVSILASPGHYQPTEFAYDVYWSFAFAYDGKRYAYLVDENYDWQKPGKLKILEVRRKGKEWDIRQVAALELQPPPARE